jgi:hypothetical protein
MTLPPLGPAQSDGHDKESGPQVPYYSLWTGPNGTSSLATCALDGFEMKSVGGQAAPLWLRQIPDEVAAVLFMVLPVGWVGEWHESPRPQWCRCRAVGSSRLRMVHASKWGRATSIGDRISTPARSTVAEATAPGRSALNPARCSWSNSRHPTAPARPVHFAET